MLRIVVALLALVAGAQAAQAGKRVALVIGNSAYANAPALPNPKQDAGDVADAFGRLGFTVTKTLDATGTDMRRALIAFGREAQGAEMAAIFFAGHGMEIGGENWLIPVDAELRSDIDIDSEAIGLRSAMGMVARASTLGMVVLDACRNNPFVNAMKRTDATRAVSRGLARVEPQSDNILVAYAARDGTTAADGSGRNSPFTTALLKNIETPGLDVRLLFGNVRDDVMKATARAQQPFSYASLPGGQIVLKAAPIAPPASVANGSSGDEIVWNYIDREDAPALRRFVAQFSQSPRSKEAQAKIAALEKAGAATATSVPPTPAPVASTQVAALPTGAAAATQRAAAIAECDRLAAHPYDQDRPASASGVDLPKIDADAAVPACRAAIAIAPGEQRIVYELGRALFAQKDYPEARRQFESAAKGSYPAAMFSMGAFFQTGQALPPNYSEARNWFEKGAMAGSAAAMVNLGTLYQTGKGVGQDDAIARTWYEKAVAIGSERAMGSLGIMYEEGQGVTQSSDIARSWYEKAAAAGDRVSMTRLGLLYEGGRGVDVNYTIARSWYEKAAQLGETAAMSNLGLMYYHAQGVSKDLLEARSWYEKAEAAGDVAASEQVKALSAEIDAANQPPPAPEKTKSKTKSKSK